MTIPQKLRDLAVSSTGFVFDPYTGATFSVNETGQVVLDGLRNGLDRDGIVAQLLAQFDGGDASQLRSDVEEFVHLLRTNALLPEDSTL